jgi:hypothetical protein
MSCIACSNIDECGTIRRILSDYGKETLVKELNKKVTLDDCKDFSFVAISGSVLRDKILEMVELSKAKRLSLKQAKNNK